MFLRRSINLTSEKYRKNFEKILRSTVFSGHPPDYFSAPTWENDLNEHLFKRYERFSENLVPWIESVFPLENSTIIEVGSGSGSATLAFAPKAKAVHCFEIDKKSIDAARARLRYFGIKNVIFEDVPFGPDSKFVQSGQVADVALFVAVLEHMKFSELEESLKTAWSALRPGGILVVAETPNRLAPNDYHTSYIPFFQMLPMELRLRICDWSHRKQLVYDMNSVPAEEREERLIRWGNGISYHDFEVAIDPQIHKWIIADGHEDAIASIVPRFADDEALEYTFEKLDLHWVNKAFTRWFLYFILRKPEAAEASA